MTIQDTETITAAPLAAVPVGTSGIRVDVQERPAWRVDGILAAFLAVLMLLVAAYGVLAAAHNFHYSGDSDYDSVAWPSLPLLLIVLLGFVGVVVFKSLTIVEPGEAAVVQFLGRYTGTVRTAGLSLITPFATSYKVSVRARNFQTETLKVNDSNGNPIEIGVIVVTQVADTAKATFAVADYKSFVATQSESAVRHVAQNHPYDNHAEAVAEGTPGAPAAPVAPVVTLRESIDEVSNELAQEVASRIVTAGVEVIEVRIAHLAYAPEIASAMLQSQQAQAVLAARQIIVRGATKMAKDALDEIAKDSTVELDPERKAQIVSNLLVVLCSDSRVTPVVNAGSLY